MPTLTELSIRKLAHPPSGSIKHMDAALPGFGIRCTVRSKAFFVMYGEGRRLKTLGKWPDLCLKDARQAARQFLSEPPKLSNSMRLSELRANFLEDCKTRLRSSTVERYFYALRGLKDCKVDQISTNIRDPNQVKALKAMFNWAIDHGYYDRNPFLRRKVRFEERDRLLTDEEIGAVWHYEQQPFSSIVKLLILTGQRRNQIWRFEPKWVRNDELVFPAIVMKGNKAHTIPITGFGEYLPDTPFAFNSWSKSKAKLDKETGVTDWVLHDFRRYFSTTMARLGVPLHITEHIIDHRSQVSGVAAIYNRYTYLDEMRDALNRYERHVRKVVADFARDGGLATA
ncbi:integrase family protein [Aestuariicoccus sp. MJ-SS9]|uniref:integrase family protein n=1 Tax=Aestuariicoccus sp. MJ-SS9 TaxID=3079855 RepID=UPI0029087BB2|nr:integrase family protein [Aestuariicoccus sp. MJ-SS9]MDU8910992.1 integrase family protein [Aestuariicoccus sp. MJ-SS9]